MSRRWRITIEDQGSVSKVRGWRVNELLVEAGIKPYFARGGWMVDAERMPDLLAYLERRGIAVSGGADAPPERHEAGDDTSTLEDRHAGLAAEDPSTDVPLWSGGDAS